MNNPNTHRVFRVVTPHYRTKHNETVFRILISLQKILIILHIYNEFPP